LGWANQVYEYGWKMPRDGFEAVVQEAVKARRFLLVETQGPFVNVWRRRRCGELVTPRAIGPARQTIYDKYCQNLTKTNAFI
jgi:hypothetical protein